MALFFVTGPVSVGKKRFADKTKRIVEKLGRRVLVSSISDVMEDRIKQFHVNSTAPMNDNLLMGIRKGLLDGFLRDIQTNIIKQKPDDIICTLPLSIINQYGVVSDQVSISGFEKILEILAEAHKQDAAYFVCLINDPRAILSSLNAESGQMRYASSIIQLLEWTSMEVMVTEMVANKFTDGRWAVLPLEYSDASLAKIICDVGNNRQPYLTYTAHPISEILRLKNSGNEDDRKMAEYYFKKIHQFKMKMQEYSIVISPIELAKFTTNTNEDSMFGPLLKIVDEILPDKLRKLNINFKTGTTKATKNLYLNAMDFESIRVASINAVRDAVDKTIQNLLIMHTIYRDLSWFVRTVDEIVAYYPGDITSPGAEHEISEAISLSRKLSFIKENENMKRETKNSIKTKNEEEGKKKSPFYFERSIPDENKFESTDSFFKSRKNRYADVEEAYKEIINEEKGK